MIRATVNLEDRRIFVRAPYSREAIDRLKLIPGARFHKPAKAWTYPATGWAARTLLEHGSGTFELLLSDGVEALVSSTKTVAEIVAKIPEGAGKISDRLRFEPRSNQIIGGRLIYELAAVGLGWQMGAGKTYGLLSGLARMVDDGPIEALCVAPAAVVSSVWPREVEKHLLDWRDWLEVSALKPGASSTDRRKDAERALERAEATGKSALIVVNYEACLARGLHDWLRRDWDLVALDEIHRITTPGAKITRYFCETIAPRAAKRVGLSGTFFRNRLLDIYGPMKFLDAGIFGERAASFRDRYAVMGGYGDHQIIGMKNDDELEEITGRVVHFVRTRDVVDLPPTQTETRKLDLEPDARRAYEELELELATEIDEGVLTAQNGLVKLLRLQQLTGGNLPVIDAQGREIQTSISKAKRRELESIMTDFPEDDPVVVFCRFRHDLAQVREAAHAAGRECFETSGSIYELEDWQDRKGGEVLAAQIQSVKEGVDLTRSVLGIFYSLGYSLFEYEQARARLDRPGQTRSVLFLHLAARGTVDVDVLRSLKSKADPIEAAIDRLKSLATGARR